MCSVFCLVWKKNILKAWMAAGKGSESASDFSFNCILFLNSCVQWGGTRLLLGQDLSSPTINWFVRNSIEEVGKQESSQKKGNSGCCPAVKLQRKKKRWRREKRECCCFPAWRGSLFCRTDMHLSDSPWYLQIAFQIADFSYSLLYFLFILFFVVRASKIQPLRFVTLNMSLN